MIQIQPEKTLYTTVAHNYGQVKMEAAYDTIVRLNAKNDGKWKQDFSPYMYVIDEPKKPNPIQLKYGHCWIVKQK